MTTYRTCPRSGLQFERQAENLMKANAFVAVVWLLIGGLLAIGVVLTRWPAFRWLEADRFLYVEATDAVQHHRVAACADANHLHDSRQGAHGVEVVERRLDDGWVALRDDADQSSVLIQFLDQADTPGSADVDRHHGHGKEDRIAEGQNGNPLGRGMHGRNRHMRTLLRGLPASTRSALG